MPVYEVVTYTPIRKRSRPVYSGLRYYVTAKNKTEAHDKVADVIGPFRGREYLIHEKEVPLFADLLDRYEGIDWKEAAERLYPEMFKKYEKRTIDV